MQFMFYAKSKDLREAANRQIVCIFILSI